MPANHASLQSELMFVPFCPFLRQEWVGNCCNFLLQVIAMSFPVVDRVLLQYCVCRNTACVWRPGSCLLMRLFGLTGANRHCKPNASSNGQAGQRAGEAGRECQLGRRSLGSHVCWAWQQPAWHYVSFCLLQGSCCILLCIVLRCYVCLSSLMKPKSTGLADHGLNCVCTVLVAPA